MAHCLDIETRKKIDNPLKFQWGTRDIGGPPAIFHGFPVTLVIDICNAIIRAESEGLFIKLGQLALNTDSTRTRLAGN